MNTKMNQGPTIANSTFGTVIQIGVKVCPLVASISAFHSARISVVPSCDLLHEL
jgi:hypothetical protein